MSLKKLILVEGIEKPSINFPPRKQDEQIKKPPPRVNAIVTRSAAQKVAQNIQNNNTEISQSNETTKVENTNDNVNTENDLEPELEQLDEGETRTIPSQKAEDNADHEENTEIHQGLREELEERTDWRPSLLDYIKNGTFPNEKWEARKLKPLSS
ncbi:hypothetical protein Bca101_012941 [Brassica carinata]